MAFEKMREIPLASHALAMIASAIANRLGRSKSAKTSVFIAVSAPGLSARHPAWRPFESLPPPAIRQTRYRTTGSFK